MSTATAELRDPRTRRKVILGDIGQFYDDPLGHVIYSYPWNTGPIAGFKGPKDWQWEFLEQLGQEVRSRGFDPASGDSVFPIEFATASGHGIGKSALSVWIIRWILDTRPYSRGVITANTNIQLRTKTWGELAKWHRMSVTRGEWDITSSVGNLSYFRKDLEYKDIWRVDGMSSDESNSESFAGLHAANSTPFYLFDEASAIPDKIWEVSDGGLTDGEPMRFVFGNPTRNQGRFRECFRKNEENWITRQIDSRDVEGANLQLFSRMEHDEGEDSDYFRIRVRGVFPRSSTFQFISEDEVGEAMLREAIIEHDAPIILGVDVARYGGCQSVIYPRCGRDAKTYPILKFRDRDTSLFQMDIYEEAMKYIDGGKDVAIVIEGNGVGGPVIDNLRQMGLADLVFEINPGSAVDAPAGSNKSQKARWANLRAKMWWKGREWIRTGGSLQDDQQLRDQLTSIEAKYNVHGQTQMETKEHMLEVRKLPSPDVADAFMLTHAIEYVSKKQAENFQPKVQQVRDSYASKQQHYHPHHGLRERLSRRN